MVQQPRVAPGILAEAAAWQWTGVGLAMLATTAVFVAMAVYVWRRRGGSAGVALALVLVALLVWAGTYSAELGAADLHSISRWGDTKYVGLVLLPPAWFAFAALFVGRGSWVNGRNLALLAIHPVVVLVLLANEATHDLIRYYPQEAVLDPDAVAEPGPLFWPHLAYSGVVMWGSLILMVSALLRASRIYRRVVTVLIVSLVVPYVFNLLYNFDVGPFGRVDLTPFLLIVSCLVLVWGLFRFRLLGIRPVARSLVFETISEAVMVLDPLRRVVDANPPAEELLGCPLADAVGRPLAELLPEATEAVRDPPAASMNGAASRLPEELVITRGGMTHRYEPTVVAMPDGQGSPVGWLMVLRDVTEHHRTLRSLRRADEQRRSLLERVVTSQEEERRQVAGDIHDDAIQAMVAVTLQLQALGGRLHDPRSTELIERLAATATESVGRLRQLVFELRPPLLDEVGLAAAIDQYARRAGELAGFVVQVTDQAAGELPDELRVVAYRIVQEALANVRAHARAHRVAVRLEEVDGGVLARVSDDGIGFLPGLVDRRPAGHLGLISMREQATMAGGWCRIASAPGMGTTVELWLPRPKEEPGRGETARGDRGVVFCSWEPMGGLGCRQGRVPSAKPGTIGMRHRLALGLIAALSLLTAACAAPAADIPASAQPARLVATEPSAAAASCPTTRPPDPAFVPPAPYPPTPPPVEVGKVWYGTNQLWTWLDGDGTWEMAHDEHGLSDKSFWWRQGYDWRTETTPQLRMTGRRLDAQAPAVTVLDATNGFEPSMGAFMLLGLELPAEGCWELTGHYHDRSLRFVVRVTRWQP